MQGNSSKCIIVVNRKIGVTGSKTGSITGRRKGNNTGSNTGSGKAKGFTQY